MRKHRAGSSGLFLMELIISILFFALAAALCLKVFAGAHKLGSRAEALSFGTQVCTDAAELISTADEAAVLVSLFDAFPDPVNQNSLTTGEDGTWKGSWSAYYDKDFISCSFDQAAYELRMTLSAEDLMLNAQIGFFDVASHDSDPLYELDILHHQRRVCHE